MQPMRWTALGVALLLGGCAAAVPGYQPPSAKLDRFKAATPTGGGFDTAGTSYKLSDQEQKLDCKALNGSITVKIIQMRDLANRQRPSPIAAAAQGVARPIVGGTAYGADVDADFRRDRARLDALNAQLASKKCPTYDLEAELKPGNANPPRPQKPAKKA